MTTTGLENIFTGTLFDTGLSIYDIYATFVVDGEKVYHRITVLYGDDPANRNNRAGSEVSGGRYVLDPLRGAKTIIPQKISDYLAYYNDEHDVHRYVGQGYSPMIVTSGEYLLPST